MITRIAIEGYRSLRDLRIAPAALTVITGANGSGKTSCYRALRLLAETGRGQVVSALAAEGGLESVLWAGPEQGAASMIRHGHPVQGTVRKGPVALKLGFATDEAGYALDLGKPVGGSAFGGDADIKVEAVWCGGVLAQRDLVALRRGPSVQIASRDSRAGLEQDRTSLAPWDSLLTHASHSGPEGVMDAVRQSLQSWRFYDGLRTDPEAPARRPALATRTLALADDGRDLGPAMATIAEIGDWQAVQGGVSQAFDGASVEIIETGRAMGVGLRQPGLLRPLDAGEMSDGTLRYLLLLAALHAPRKPALLVLNEPEASLHPTLHGPLAAQIAAASQETQIIVVSHAPGLCVALERAGAQTIHLIKHHGETQVDGDDPPHWVWPKR